MGMGDIENYVGGESVFEYEETRTGISSEPERSFPAIPDLVGMQRLIGTILIYQKIQLIGFF